MHKLLILSKHAGAYRQLIEAEKLPALTVLATSEPDVAIARGGDCDCVFGEPSLVPELLPHLLKLRWVQSTWAGIEPLLDPSLRRDYVLTNARGVYGSLMIEYVFGYLLAHERRIIERFQSQQESRWDDSPPGTLRGKLLGLLGVGSIGAALAHMAKQFGMQVRGFTRSSEDSLDVDRYFHGGELLDFAAELDYLVSVLPSTAKTRHIVDGRLLAALTSRAVLVNVGRGSAVDEAALAEALQAERLAGAVLDVFDQEPLPPDSVLWRTPKVLITGHTAAMNVPEDIVGLFVENYRRFIAGEPLLYQVDFASGY